MKRTAIAILIFLVAAVSANAGTYRTETIKNQGLERTYHLYIPDGVKPDAPLVFVLHGYGGKADGYRKEFYPLADEYGFVVCYPQASPDPRGKNSWNCGYPWQVDAMQVDDCQFILDLAAHLQSKYNLSAKNTFFSGMSNGGEMCYLMAFRHPEAFGAIASMAGLMLVNMMETYEFKGQVPFMEVHGTLDKTSRWEGDPVNQFGWGAYCAVPLAVGAVVANNRCVFEETIEFPSVKNRVVLHRYYGGINSTEVLFYEVVEGAHNWALDSFDSCRAIFEFFKSHLR